MLAIARAIVEPRRLLLIDEPTKGLAPAIIDNMIERLRASSSARGTTILLVEQNFRFAATLGDTVAVMDDGRIVASRRDGRRWPPTQPCSSGCSASSLDAHQ